MAPNRQKQVGHARSEEEGSTTRVQLSPDCLMSWACGCLVMHAWLAKLCVSPFFQSS